MNQAILFIFVTIMFIGCQSVKKKENITQDNVLQSKSESAPTPDKENYTTEQLHELKKKISPEAKYILENAEVLEIKIGKSLIQISDSSQKRELLEAIFSDMTPPKNFKELKKSNLQIGKANCFDPQHFLRAVRQDKSVEIALCYSCNNVEVKSDAGKTFTGELGKKSLAVFDEILEKHNEVVQ